MSKELDKLLAEKADLEKQFQAKEKALAEELNRLGLSVRLKWRLAEPTIPGVYLIRYQSTGKNKNWILGSLVVSEDGRMCACTAKDTFQNVVRGTINGLGWQIAGPIDMPLTTDVDKIEPVARRKVTVNNVEEYPAYPAFVEDDPRPDEIF